MKNKLLFILVALQFSLMIAPTNVQAGEPLCHVMICCKSCNEGVTFLVNGEWNANHDYRDLDQARDIMQNIKDAGINTIIVDLTNPSQWGRLWDVWTLPAIQNIQQVCVEKDMQYLIHMGGQLSASVREEENIPSSVTDFEYWNEKAKYIYENWASEDIYRKYGYGDDRPMLLIFTPGQEYWSNDAAAPAENKTYLELFYRGTMQVNNVLTDAQRQETSGWGYRKTNWNTSRSVRYTSPQGGDQPTSWHKVTPEKFAEDVQWVSEASEYSVYGSYDDTCDGILWGIADTKNTYRINSWWQPGDPVVYYNRYPNDWEIPTVFDGEDPFIYYDILKKELNPGTVTTPPAHLFATTDAGVRQVKLGWANNTETEFSGTYKVYRSEQSGGQYSEIAEVNTSNYADTIVEYDKRYFYIVTAIDNSGVETENSNEVTAKPKLRDKYVFKFDFNISGNVEGWTGNDHVGGLIQATSADSCGVLKSENGVQGIDPRLYFNSVMTLPADYSSWDQLEIRFRQLDLDGNPQQYVSTGTIAYFIFDVHKNYYWIQEPTYQMEFEDEGEWVKATLDISENNKETINQMFIDLIGDAPGIGKNFELDYVYLTGILSTSSVGDSKLTEPIVHIYPNPANNMLHIETSEQIKIEIFNLLGQKVYQNNEESHAKKVDVSTWTPGLYVVKVKNNQQVYSQKIVVK